MTIELTRRNRELDDARQAVHNHERYLREDQNNLEVYQNQLENLARAKTTWTRAKDFLERMNALHPDSDEFNDFHIMAHLLCRDQPNERQLRQYPDWPDDDAIHTFSHRVRGLNRTLENIAAMTSQCKQRLMETEQHLAELTARLPAVKQKLALLSGQDRFTITLDEATLKAELLGIDKLQHVEISHGSDLLVRCKFSNLVMSPPSEDDAKYARESRNYPITDIPLPPLTVELRMREKRTDYWYFTITEGVFLEGFESRALGHPHWISEHEPCFGDFYTPIKDALEQGDIGTAFMLIKLFLEQYDPQDCAGKYAIQWARYHQNPGAVEHYGSYLNSCREEEEDEEYDDDDDHYCDSCGEHHDHCEC